MGCSRHTGRVISIVLSIVIVYSTILSFGGLVLMGIRAARRMNHGSRAAILLVIFFKEKTTFV